MPLALGIIALLVGVAALLPWLVERVVARLGAGAVAWQLAVRRLQLDPGGAVARRQRDRGRGGGRDRAADGLLRRAGALPGGDGRGPEPRAARASIRDAPTSARTSARRAAAGGARRPLGHRRVTEYDGLRSTSARARRCASWRRSATCAPGDTFATASPDAAGADASVARARGPGRRACATASSRREAPAARPDRGCTRSCAPTRPRTRRVRNAAAELDPLLDGQPGRADRDRRAVRAHAPRDVRGRDDRDGADRLQPAADRARAAARAAPAAGRAGRVRHAPLARCRGRCCGSRRCRSALGLAVAVATGIGLGAILLAVIDTGVRVAWLDVLGDGGRRRRGGRARHRGEPAGPVPHDATGRAANGVICSSGRVYCFL